MIKTEKCRQIYHAEIIRKHEGLGAQTPDGAGRGQQVERQLSAENGEVNKNRFAINAASMANGTTRRESLCDRKKKSASGRSGLSRVRISRNCWMFPAMILTRRPNPVISWASSYTIADGS